MRPASSPLTASTDTTPARTARAPGGEIDHIDAVSGGGGHARDEHDLRLPQLQRDQARRIAAHRVATSPAADGPGRRALLRVEHRGALVLLGLRGGGRIAGAADGCPRALCELILPVEP